MAADWPGDLGARSGPHEGATGQGSNAAKIRQFYRFFAYAMIVGAMGALGLGVWTLHQGSVANAYDASPVCTSGQPFSAAAIRSDARCRFVEPATVGAAPTLARGKNAGTQLTLRTAAGVDSQGAAVAAHTYQVKLGGDEASVLKNGQAVTITLWHSEVTEVAAAAQSWQTSDNPHWLLGTIGAFTAVPLVFCASVAAGGVWLIYKDRVGAKRVALIVGTLWLLTVGDEVLYVMKSVVAASSLLAVTLALMAVVSIPWMRAVLRPKRVLVAVSSTAERTA